MSGILVKKDAFFSMQIDYCLNWVWVTFIGILMTIFLLKSSLWCVWKPRKKRHFEYEFILLKLVIEWVDHLFGILMAIFLIKSSLWCVWKPRKKRHFEYASIASDKMSWPSFFKLSITYHGISIIHGKRFPWGPGDLEPNIMIYV